MSIFTIWSVMDLDTAAQTVTFREYPNVTITVPQYDITHSKWVDFEGRYGIAELNINRLYEMLVDDWVICRMSEDPFTDLMESL